MKKNKVQKEFIAQLKTIPIIQVACEKVGISRNSIYRWKKEDPEFRKQMEEALVEGEALVNDMSESQLLSMIKEKNWSAISFWLRHRNPKFRDRVEVTTPEDSGELTPSQEKVVRKALQLAALIKINEKNHVQSKKSNSGKSIQQDDSGQNNTNDTN